MTRLCLVLAFCLLVLVSLSGTHASLIWFPAYDDTFPWMAGTETTQWWTMRVPKYDPAAHAGAALAAIRFDLTTDAFPQEVVIRNLSPTDSAVGIMTVAAGVLLGDPSGALLLETDHSWSESVSLAPLGYSYLNHTSDGNVSASITVTTGLYLYVPESSVFWDLPMGTVDLCSWAGSGDVLFRTMAGGRGTVAIYYAYDDGNPEPPIPEPGTLALLGAGLSALGLLRRRRVAGRWRGRTGQGRRQPHHRPL